MVKEIDSMSKIKKYKVKGEFLDRNKDPVVGLEIRFYDNDGKFIGSTKSDKSGKIDWTCTTEPKYSKFTDGILAVKTVEVAVAAGVVDLGTQHLCIPLPKDNVIKKRSNCHIYGTVTDLYTGEVMPGLKIEVYDSDPPLWDQLGVSITNAQGRYSIFFHRDRISRDEGWDPDPDIYFMVYNNQGDLLQQTDVIWSVDGTWDLDCGWLCNHWDAEIDIPLDIIKAEIHKLGPVDVADIDLKGLAKYGPHVNDVERPFGGYITITGKIWGGNLDRWQLRYCKGFIDSADIDNPAHQWTPIESSDTGPAKVWNGVISKWTTDTPDNGDCTLLLEVWDKDGCRTSVIQRVFVRNHPANMLNDLEGVVTMPAPGSTYSRGTDGDSVEFQGTATSKYFKNFALHWAGGPDTSLDGLGVQLANDGNSAVKNGHLASWDISARPNGPYVMRLIVNDKTIRNDGNSAWQIITHNTYNITD